MSKQRGFHIDEKIEKGLYIGVLNKKLKIKFEKAINLGKLRKYEEAAELLASLIKETDEIPEAYLYLGRSYHSLNRLNEAVPILRHYLTLVPDSSMGSFFLGRSLLSLGLAKNSISYLKKSVNAHPESLHANGFLGIAYLNAGRSDVAIKYLSKAAEYSTEGTGIYKIYLGTLFVRAVSNFKSGDTELAAQMFNFLIDHDFDNILPFIYMGMIERQNKNYKAALSYYDEALTFSPEDRLLLYRRAVLLYKVGNSSLAVEELKKLEIEPDTDENIYLAYEFFNNKEFNKALYYGNMALHSDNQSIELHLLLGELNRELSNFDLAENHYRKAIKLDRTRLEGRYGLSLILWLKHDYKTMIIELKKIDVSDPGNSISSYYTSLCRCKLNYDTDITIPAVQEEIRNNGPDCYLFTSLGEEYTKAGLNHLSEKWFVKAIVINKEFVEAHINLIEFYKISNNNEKLLESYKNFLDISDDLDKNLEYIKLLYQYKYFVDTIIQINKVLPSLPSSIKLLRMLANSYRFTKKWDRAIIIYRQILSKEPENEIILQSLVYCLDHSGKKKIAIELIENAISYLKKPSINLELIKGVLYFKNKQFDNALKVFRHTLNQKPDDWRIYHNIAMIYKEKGLDDYAEQFFSRAKEHKNN